MCVILNELHWNNWDTINNKLLCMQLINNDVDIMGSTVQHKIIQTCFVTFLGYDKKQENLNG